MRKFLIAIAAITVVAIAGTSVFASVTKPKLSFIKDGGASIGWATAGGSSPADTYPNSSSIRIVAPAGGGASAYTYGASEDLVSIRGLKLSQIDHLGFDSSGYLGNGAPRISLGTTGPSGDHTFFL